MIRLRRGTVIEARAAHPGLTDLTVDLDGTAAQAVAYDVLTGPVRTGDAVLLNTAAVELGLGTGGVHFVVANLTRAPEPDPPEGASAARGMKLRYTPHQIPVEPVEEAHQAAVDALATLEGMPVVAAGLHSALAPAAIGARAVAPGSRIAYVMTDGGALPMAFSRVVPALRAAGLVDVTVSCGQAFGGDLEAVNLYSGLAAARAVGGADLAIVAMGPGNLGTASRLGFALIETGAVVNAAAGLGGRPIVAPRLSFTDPRARHRGVSHHTITAMTVAALARAEIALPPLAPERAAEVRAALEPLAARHTIVDVDLGPARDALARSPVPLSSMGRGYADDPDAFRASAAAGVLAARALG